MTTDLKIDTIALFIAKTVEKNSSLQSPYYREQGWSWLDKFYDHSKLKKEDV